MAINIGKNTDGDVTYKNPPVDRTLFPNITEYSTPEEIEAFVNAWLDDHPEATTTVEDGSILPVKLDSSNSASDGYVLSYNATAGKFEWYNIGAELDEINSDITDLKQDFNQYTAEVLGLYPQMEITDTAIASFTDGADNIPVKSLTVDIIPVQSGTGDPSPSNVRPISGWTGANVFRSAKNLFNVYDKLTTIGSVHNYYLRLKPNTAYTCSSNCPQGSPANVYFGGGSTDNNGVYNGHPQTVTSDSSGYIQLSVRFNPEGTGINMYLALVNGTYWLQVEEGSTATEYEPVTRYNIDWTTEAGTVYGGTLDVTSGVLTVTYGVADLGTLNWTYSSADGQPCFTSSDLYSVAKGEDSYDVIPPFLCSKYVGATWNQNRSSANYDNTIALAKNASMSVRDSAYTTVASFKTAASGTLFVYELATPVTYQLTPTEVTTLLRNNNIFADTGNVAELTYRADLKAYIDEKLA